MPESQRATLVDGRLVYDALLGPAHGAVQAGGCRGDPPCLSSRGRRGRARAGGVGDRLRAEPFEAFEMALDEVFDLGEA